MSRRFLPFCRDESHSRCTARCLHRFSATGTQRSREMARPFHLAWFLQGSSVQAWGEPWTGHIGTNWEQPELFLDMARSLERACFDYILLEDSSYVGESFGGSTELYLKHGIAVPRQDPSV